MRVLVTGPTGFLGYNLCKKLIDSETEIYAISRNLPPLSRKVESKNINYFQLEDINIDEFISKNKINGIIHCATNYGRNDNALDTLQANLTFPLTVLLASIKANVEFFINTDTILDKRVNSYSLSKKQFLDWLYYFKNNINCLNLSLEHFYGPGDSDGKFTTFIIKEIIKNTKQIDLTPGQQKRDFVYIDDVVSAFISIIEAVKNYKRGKIHNIQIGSGVNTSIYDFANLVKNIIGNNTTNLNFGAIPYRENEVMQSDVNLDNILKLGWRPKVSLKEGLKKTIKNELLI